MWGRTVSAKIISWCGVTWWAVSWWTRGRLIRAISTVIISITTPHARNAQIIVADEVTVSAVVQTSFPVICQVEIVWAGTTVAPSGLEQTKAGTGGVCTRGGEGRLTKRMNYLKYARKTKVYLTYQDELWWPSHALNWTNFCENLNYNKYTKTLIWDQGPFSRRSR